MGAIWDSGWRLRVGGMDGKMEVGDNEGGGGGGGSPLTPRDTKWVGVEEDKRERKVAWFLWTSPDRPSRIWLCFSVWRNAARSSAKVWISASPQTSPLLSYLLLLSICPSSSASVVVFLTFCSVLQPPSSLPHNRNARWLASFRPTNKQKHSQSWLVGNRLSAEQFCTKTTRKQQNDSKDKIQTPSCVVSISAIRGSQPTESHTESETDNSKQTRICSPSDHLFCQWKHWQHH